MRIKRLLLSAYGPFTDRALEFGDGRGVHVIFGANEAGKSTTLRALGSVLFGYPREVIDLHGRPTRDLLLGGVLEDRAGRELSFTRRRSGTPLLRDHAGEALSDGAVTTVLGGISRELFERVFALSHDGLVEHGEALLSDDGTLGYSLFETGAGVRGVKGALSAMRSEAEELFVPQGRQRKINEAIRQLLDKRKEAKGLMLKPDRFDEMQRGLAEAEAAIAAAQSERRKIEKEVARLERIGRNQPRVARRAQLGAERALLGEVVALPASFSTEREAAEKALAVAEREAAAAGEEIAAIEPQLAALFVDERVLSAKEEIAGLAERRGKVRGAEDDLPKRLAELAGYEEQIALDRRRAEIPETADLDRVIPSALARKKMEALVREGESLLVERASREAELGRAKDKLAAAEAAPGREKARDVTELAAALSSVVKRGDLDARVDEAARAIGKKTDRLGVSIKALGIASGRAVDLRAQPFPPVEAVERFRTAMERAERELEAADGELKRAEAVHAASEQRLAAIGRGAAPPTMGALKQARGEREAAWALVRGLHVDGRSELAEQAAAFDPPRSIAAAFERRVIESDRLADALRDDAKRGAEYELLVAQTKESLRLREEAKTRRAEALANRQARLSDWCALAEPSGLAMLTPAEAAGRLREVKEVLAQVEAMGGDEEELSSRTRARDQARALIVEAIARAGAPTASTHDRLSAVLDRTQAFVKRQNELAADEKEASRAAAAAARDLEEALRARSATDEKTSAWRTRFREAMSGIGRSEDSTLEEVREYLRITGDIDQDKRKADDLAHRIERMREDRAAFDQIVEALVKKALPGARFHDTLAASEALEAALSAAEKAKSGREHLSSQHERQLRAYREATRAMEAARAILRALCEKARCSEVAALAQAEAQAARAAELDSKLRDLDSQLLDDGGGADLAGVIVACGACDADSVADELSTLSRRREEIHAREMARVDDRARLRAEAREVEDRALAGRLLQEAEIATTTLGDLVEKYVALAVSEALVTAALERYRERNQGPILKRATGLFSQLTDGAFSGLQLDSEGKEEKPMLVAVRASNGSHLEVKQLSDGTRDQLYLALRLAVIQEHNAAREPLPFIADDLLLTFDDGRSAAAFRTLAEIGAHNQVLFFTHHEHMVALAKRAVPAHLLHVQSLNA